MALSPQNPSLEQRALAEAAGRAIYVAVRTAPDGSRVGRAMTPVRQAVDRELDALTAASGTALDCRRGCSYCCYQVVPVTVAELAAAVEYVGEKFSDEQKAALKLRIESYLRAVAPSFGTGLEKVRVACPLLVDGECSAYEVRPLRCRGVHSRDATVCLQMKEHPDEIHPVPAIPGRSQLARAAHSGIHSALGQAGVFNDQLDFGRALGMCLDDPTLLPAYFSGDPALVSCVYGQHKGEAPLPPAALTDPPGYGPGAEPTGKIDVTLFSRHLALYRSNDTRAALDVLTGRHPVNLLRRLIVPRFYDSVDEILEWRARLQTEIENLQDAQLDPREAFDAVAALQMFELAYQQMDDKAMMSQLGDFVHDRISSAVAPDLTAPIDRPRKPGPVRVGYIGCNLSTSNGGNWALGWLQNHPKEYETYVLYLGHVPDVVTRQFSQSCTHYRHLTGPVLQDARLVRELDLDVLIYPDVWLAGRNSQFASFRLARVQCTGWGHPVTTGLPTIDSYLSAADMEPESAQDSYREKLVCLPHTGLFLKPTTLRRGKLVKADFGLDDGPLLLSCQNPMKFAPQWDSLYREICERTGRPIVFTEGAMFDVSPLKARMARAGIDARWIPGLGPADFLSLVAVADVCLDTPGWNGGNTTVQAYELGKPVVSLPGPFMRGRHTVAFARQANATALLAGSNQEYVDLAVNVERAKDLAAAIDPGGLFYDRAPVHSLNQFIESQ